MKKIISPQITSFAFSVLVLTFLAVFYAIAWTEPSQAPPAGNVAAPLNVSNTGQSKSGGLILNTGGAVNGLVIDQGNLCLGADCRSSWPGSGTLSQTYTTCNMPGGASPNVSCTTPTCPAGYVRSGCSMNCSGSTGLGSCVAIPSGNDACSCSISVTTNYAGGSCYNYCIKLTP